MKPRLMLTSTVWLAGALLPWHSAAQPRPIISVEEAQTPPHIEREQLRTPQIRANNGSNAQSQALEKLQQTASAPAASSAAARQQQAEAMWQLGLLQLHGLHLPINPSQAKIWFQKAQQSGHPLAVAGLVWCAMDGCGERPDPQSAQTWLPLMRKQIPARAAYFDWLLLDEAAPLPSDLPSTAPQLQDAFARKKQAQLLRAVQANDPLARVEWGLELAAQGKTQEARAQFQAAASRSAAAKHNLQILNDDSASVSGNKRPQSGGGWQTFRQARVYHRGEGVPANYTEALRLYKRASDLGSIPAQRMLALIYSRPQADGKLDIAWMQQLAYVDVTEDSTVPLQAVTTPAGLQRDPSPLYDYIAPQWRK